MRIFGEHRQHVRACAAALAAVVSGALLGAVPRSEPSAPGGFGHPERVTIVGYDGDAMEPFITRDGRYLLFNNRNDPPERTDLFYAERIDGRTFRFRGPLRGANSPGLDAVASVDCVGTMIFVSNRSYATTFSTIYRARFRAGIVTGVELAPGVSQQRNGAVNFDAEISPDGRDLYVVESDFDASRGPKTARIALFHARGGGFVRDPASDTLLAAVNADALQYAPSISASGRELFFTRPDLSVGRTALFRSVRTDNRHAFGVPKRMEAAPGFVEAPSLSIDGRSLYYHLREDGRFVIERLTRSARDAGPPMACDRVMRQRR